MEEKEIKLSKNFLYMLFAIVALGLFVVCKICANFGVSSSIFYGIMSIFIFCLSFVGLLLSFFAAKKPTFEFWVNLAVLIIAIWFM